MAKRGEFESGRPMELLLARLARSARLEGAAVAALQALPFKVRYLRRDDPIHPAGQPADLQMIFEGAAARYKSSPWVERTIVAFQLPGDILDWPLFSLRLRGGSPAVGLQHPVEAISDCAVAAFPPQPVALALREHPSIALAFDAAAIVDSDTAMEWLANVGSRPAAVRLARLLLEYFYRVQAVGLADGQSCRFNLTQLHMAASQGVSIVYTNRLLKRLRSAGLITLSGRTLTLVDQQGLESFADFSPAYLGFQG